MITFALVYEFVKRYWKYIVIGLAVIILALILYNAFNTTPKLDQDELRKVQDAIESTDRQKRIEVLTEIAVKRKDIDSNVAAGRIETLEAVREIRDDLNTKTNKELADILNQLAEQ